MAVMNELIDCKSFGKSFESLEDYTKKGKGYLEIKEYLISIIFSQAMAWKDLVISTTLLRGP